MSPTLDDRSFADVGVVSSGRPRLATTVRNLRAEAGLREVVKVLGDSGVMVMLLKGPGLKRRLFGDPAVYDSGDVDVLIRRPSLRRARSALENEGFVFEPTNGLLWRLSGAATFGRDDLRIDLHWGIHAAHLPSWSMRSLEKQMWSGATRHRDGYWEPDPESLLVFLALHAAGHWHERPSWDRNVAASADLVTDWKRVHEIARIARVEGVVSLAAKGQRVVKGTSLLDGYWGSVVWRGTWVIRGHFIPARIRGFLRHRRRVSKLVNTGRSRCRVSFAGRDLVVPSGVFIPQPISYRLAQAAMESVPDSEKSVVVDVGTGSGAVALAVARALSKAAVFGTDASRRAVRCARSNARRWHLRNVQVFHGDLLDPLPEALRGKVSMILANIPYLRPGTSGLGAWAGLAEDSGSDGLALLRRLLASGKGVLAPGGLIALQISDEQSEALVAELVATGYDASSPTLRRPGKAVVVTGRWLGTS